MTQPLALGYLCSQYPAVSHTFINREIEQLEKNGLAIHPFSMRPGHILEGATPFEKAQLDATWVIHRQSKLYILTTLPLMFLRGPLRFLSGLWFAIALQKGRPRETLWALFHLLEAGMVAREMRKRGLNHLHVHFANSETAIALYAHKAFGISYSFTLHGPDCFYNVDLGFLPTKIQHAAFIVAISHFATGQIIRLAGVAAMDKIIRVRCGVDPETYLPSPRTASFSQKPFRIVCTGRLTPTKGQALLLRACAQLAAEKQNFECILIGTGEEFQNHTATIKELGLEARVRLTGALPQEGVRQHLTEADLFVLPSFAEGVPVVLMEAMSMGIPCVSTRVGGIAELIENDVNGWLIHSGDVQGLTDTLRQAINGTDRLPELGRAARATILDRFDVRKSGAKLAAYFKKRLSEPNT